MKNAFIKDKGNQDGSTLVVVLIVLAAVTALGIMATLTGYSEMKVAANDKFHKMAFCAADSACDMTAELIEQNIEERGFSTATWGNGSVGILTGDFYMNEEIVDDSSTADDESLLNRPTSTNRDIEMPDIGNGTAYVTTYAVTNLSAGSNIVEASGYEGKGKGLAGGGAFMLFEVRSVSEGPSQSTARVWMQWLSLI